ncbi:chitosanase [Mycetocola sp. BIGb0189]|uniref:chitosanase n=1 Tax=Mycetocola sp. BIGb0189 TaxID=2940604 RepID=UPI00286E1047|nr:chitosanase [Mycetocola sp. BIGb0189]MCS4277144.1 chitosanase [Mycetocola sp. BIGb0189]
MFTPARPSSHRYGWVGAAALGAAILTLTAGCSLLPQIPQPAIESASESVAPEQKAPEATLNDPRLKDIAMQLVSSAENSTLDWKDQYGYIEDIEDGRGFTAGIIGFTTGTGDLLEVVRAYTRTVPGNALAAFIPALEKVNGTDSHDGLGPDFEQAWTDAADDPKFRAAQDAERDREYFDPAVSLAVSDGLRPLGQFAYYDAAVVHGTEGDEVSLEGIRKTAMKKAKTPAQGGDEKAYLNAFLDARVAAMKTEEAHDDTSRIDTAQRVFLKAGNFDLTTPLEWRTYGDRYRID